MNFFDLIKKRKSCRSFDTDKNISKENLIKILDAGRLAPSACNSQPWFFTLVENKEKISLIGKHSKGPGINSFVGKANAIIIISEANYNTTAKFGSIVKGTDYKSIDIGLATSFMTLGAEQLGISSCIIGWFNGDKISKLCNIDGKIRLLLCLGYAKNQKPANKKRKELNKISKII